ncbi:MAG: efflux RND transporter permease subunit, partial [Candidatus Omnitrophica bacterium]|nr:efflux RND transporter permease subunit [Candidatus Omnitrophota bacterium]
MSVFRISVDRPTTVTMIFLGIALFGIISFYRLPQELFPSLDYPQITIITKYEGAGPEESEKLISKLIEETVGTAKNIKRVTSISKEGVSIVVCEFYWGTDINFAALEVREKIDLIKERLPKDSQEPIVLKYNPFRLEAMNLSVSYKIPQDDPIKLAELRMLCKKNLKDELERLEGVAKVELYGGAEKEILVEVDKGRLLANQISILDIIRTLKETNITYPAGAIKEDINEYVVKTIGEFKNIKEIQELQIPVERRPEYDKYKRYRRKKEKEDRPVVYLSDIAEVKESIKDIKGYSRCNAKNHISVSIYPQSKANLINMSKVVRKRLNEIIKTKFPDNVELKIIYDQAEFIKLSLNNIYSSAIQGGILAFFVLFIFLKDIVASVIIIISIPLAILATLSLMYFGGISINTMSLGGLALGVGMLVDNSIVVLEKIFVEKEKNPQKDKKEIIYSASSHVVGEIISSTLTTVAIFIPLVFVGGVVGQLFKQLALTVSFSLFSSILVALFLVPRLALWLNLEKYAEMITQTTTKKDKLNDLLKKFPQLLNKVLDMPIKITYGTVFIYLFVGLIIFYFIPKEFMPKLDERKFILTITLPSSTILEKTNEIASQIERFIMSLAETKDIIVNIGSAGEEKTGEVETLGPNQAKFIVQLKNKGRKTSEIVSLLNKEIKKIRFAKIEAEFITQQGLFGSGVGSGSDIAVEVKGKEINKLEEYAKEVANFLKEKKDLYGIKIIPLQPVPELKIEVYRDRASLFGLSVQDISATILVGIKGYVPTKFKLQEDEFDIRVRLSPKDRTELSKVSELTVYSKLLDRNINLVQFTDIKLEASFPEIRRTEGQRMYIVFANVKKGFSKVIRELINFKNELLSKEQDVYIDITGEVLALRESISSSFFALILGIIVIYMILASQFESLVQPLIIMVTVPLGLIGAIYSLFLTFNTINSISMLGFIMLIGIVVNNGII